MIVHPCLGVCARPSILDRKTILYRLSQRPWRPEVQASVNKLLRKEEPIQIVDNDLLGRGWGNSGSFLRGSIVTY